MVWLFFRISQQRIPIRFFTKNDLMAWPLFCIMALKTAGKVGANFLPKMWSCAVEILLYVSVQVYSYRILCCFLWNRQFEQELETVVKVLQPGPLGIVEHKFSAEEVREANATVCRAVSNWRRNANLEQKNPILKDYIQK